MDSFVHRPVLLEECLTGLALRPDGDYVDGTVGGAGHSEAIARQLQSGRLLAIDKDPDALQAAAKRLAPYPCARVVEGDFAHIARIAPEQGFDSLDGVLLDIGVSSHQLDTPVRGFSFHADAPLDMRMSQKGVSARDIVNDYTAEQLAHILFTYGEERHARLIARKILERRQQKPIETTLELADIIKSALPPAARRKPGHPAQQSFQAIRMAVNDELGALSQGIEGAFDLLKPGGRLAIISFHSLEDRIVKQSFAQFAKGCTCPPDFPVCICNKQPRGKLITRKPITAGEQELNENIRSRSAKLRIIEKLPPQSL
jgi:16S rRNA (cytosine1402-N4)-methyltransferase